MSIITPYVREVVTEASYIINKKGSKYYTRDGSTGKIAYSGTVAYDVIQNVFDNISDGESILFKNAEYPVTTGLTLGGAGNKRGCLLTFESGFDEYVSYGARLTSTLDIDLLTLQTNATYCRVIGGGFYGLAGGTKYLINNLGARNYFGECNFRGGGIGIKLGGAVNYLVNSKFYDQATIGIEKAGTGQRVYGNRISSNRNNVIGIKVTDGSFGDIIGPNYTLINGTNGIGVEIDANGKWIVMQGGKYHDSNINIKITDAHIVSLQSLVVEGCGTYNIQVVTVSEWCALMGIDVHLENNNEIGFRIEGGTVLLSGCAVNEVGTPTGTKSYETSGGTIIERGCYSYDGLLEGIS